MYILTIIIIIIITINTNINCNNNLYSIDTNIVNGISKYPGGKSCFNTKDISSSIKISGLICLGIGICRLKKSISGYIELSILLRKYDNDYNDSIDNTPISLKSEISMPINLDLIVNNNSYSGVISTLCFNKLKIKKLLICFYIIKFIKENSNITLTITSKLLMITRNNNFKTSIDINIPQIKFDLSKDNDDVIKACISSSNNNELDFNIDNDKEVMLNDNNKYLLIDEDNTNSNILYYGNEESIIDRLYQLKILLIFIILLILICYILYNNTNKSNYIPILKQEY